MDSSIKFERFVTADEVAIFLSTTRHEVLRLTRAGTITGYPLSGKVRKTYKYLLSEVKEDVTRRKSASTISRTSSPSGSRKGA